MTKFAADFGTSFVCRAGSTDFSIHLPAHQSKRVRKHHFKPGANTAGTFLPKWQSPAMVLREIGPELAEDCLEYCKAGESGEFSVEIEFLEEPVGWSGVVSLDRVCDEWLECFEPNRRSTAKQVKAESKILAPLTNIVTVVYSLHFNGGAPKVVIHSLYPGQDVGKLKGDITSREGVAFFGWEHPGAPLPRQPVHY